MLSRIVVVPCPPLLVPELTVRATPEVHRLRDACSRAVSSLTDDATDWVALGVDQSGEHRFAGDLMGSFGGFGVERVVGLRGAGHGSDVADRTLPLPVLMAAFLREQAGHDSVEVQLLGPDTTAAHAHQLGPGLATSDGPRALVVFADGSNRRDERSPYPPDPRAAVFDESVRALLARADTAGLRALDASVGAELGVSGIPALWAAAAAADYVGRAWTPRLEYSAAPFGVTYHVAVWRLDGAI